MPLHTVEIRDSWSSLSEVHVATDQVRAGAVNLRDLFQGSRYLIDVYQREYAWSAADVQTLATDLWDAFDTHDQSSRRAREQIFLGPFVYVESAAHTRYLVDGQQRFTTLHLMFLHLDRIAQASGARSVAGKLHAMVYEFFEEGKPTQFRLDIDERRAALEALHDEQRFDIQGKSLSVGNLWQRGQQVQEFLDERINTENCARFVDWLLTQVVMVAIRAPDRASGYRIFESMNDRGTRLTPVDLLKSFLLREVGGNEEELNDRWRAMLAELTGAGRDQDTPSTFLKAALRAHWARTADSASKDAEEIDLALHLWVKGNKNLLGLHRDTDYYAFINKLIQLAGHYTMFLRAARNLDRQFNLAAVYFNRANGLSNQMALLLAAVRPEDQPSAARPKAAQAAQLLDLLYVTRALADEPTDAREFQPAIDRLLPQLRTCRVLGDVTRTLADELPLDDPFVDVPTFGIRGNNTRQVRYLLARLTTFVETGCERVARIEEFLDGQRRWQIEHVFPNHPKPYVAEISDPATFRALRSRIGVLLLLPARDNASYQDVPFREKIAYYMRQNQLAAIYEPTNRRRNPSLRSFVRQNDLEALFHDFGPNPGMRDVVRGRGDLYRQLCRLIWSTAALGLPLPWEQGGPHPSTAPSAIAAVAPSEPPARTQAVAKPEEPKRRGPAPQMTQLIQAGILTAGTKLKAEFGPETYTAVIDGDRIQLPSGDRYRLPDEAAAVVRGRQNVRGMTFWHVEQGDGSWISLRDLYDRAKQQGRIGGGRRH